MSGIAAPSLLAPATTNGHVATWNSATKRYEGAAISIPAAANPTGTIGAAAVNGVLTTFMRSDGAPALPATLPALSGVNLTALNASNIASGSLADARLSANVPLLNAANVFTLELTLAAGMKRTSTTTWNNLDYLSSTAGHLGFNAGTTKSSLGASFGPFYLALGNTFSTVANLRGNIVFSAGLPSSPTANEGSVEFRTNDVQRIRILSGGRVLMGATLPTDDTVNAFQVSGTARISGDIFGIATAKTPASAAATGVIGSICWDSGFLYVCTAADTWERVAIATW